MTRHDTHGKAWRGYLILLGIVLAAALIFNLQALRELAGERLDLVALLPDASGVRVGTPVRIAGVESGRVTSISFLSAGGSAQVALRVRVEGEGLGAIRQDSEVRAVRMRMIGQPLVEIGAGSRGAPPVESGDTLRARFRLDPRVLWEQGKTLPASLDSLLNSARTVAEMARASEPRLTLLQERVDAVTAAAAVLTKDLEGGSLGSLLAPGGLASLEGLRIRLAELSSTVDSAMARYRGTAEAPAPLTTGLASLRERVAGVQADLDDLALRMADGGGILYRMPRDSAIQVAVRGVQAQIDSLRAEAMSIALKMVLP